MPRAGAAVAAVRAEARAAVARPRVEEATAAAARPRAAAVRAAARGAWVYCVLCVRVV